MAGEKLTSEARAHAFVDYVDVDAPCCHPLHACGLWDQDRLPLIQKFCANCKQVREGIAAYLNISIADAKLELIKLFYGARPTMQLPWTLVLSSEIVDASDLLLACPELAGHNATYAGRPSSVFSGLRHPLAHREQSSDGAVRQGSGGGEHQRPHP